MKNDDFHRVNSHDRCWACQSDHGCTWVWGNGTRISLCLRIRDSRRVSKDGRAIHRFPDKSPADGNVGSAIAISRPLPAPIKRRHAVYQKMLNNLVLEDRDYEHLKSRGLSEYMLAKLTLECGYNSTADVAQILDSQGFILDRVAGFYKDDGVWKANTWEGFFIPVRDNLGRIQALQIRTIVEKPKYIWFSSFFKTLPDGKRQVCNNGASSGAPIHWVPGKGLTVWVIEGILKADICGMLTGFPFLGKAGTSAGIKDVADASLKFDSVVLAYDQDWKDNDFVRRDLIKQYEAIKERSGVPVKIAIWEGYKGLDDLLLSGETKIVAAPFEEICKTSS